MVRTINLQDITESEQSRVTGQGSGTLITNVVGLHYAAPALSAALVAYGIYNWSTVPSLLDETASNSSVSDWSKRYSGIGGNSEMVAGAVTLVSGLRSVTELPFESFARFYFIVGSLSTSIYLISRPYIKYKVTQIAQYGGKQGGSSLYPKKDLRRVLYFQLGSSFFALTGLASYGYGLYHALNNL